MTAARNQVLWTDREAAALGPSSAPWSATGVSIDSRAVSPGDLFVALAGPNFDGHDFAAQAQAAGAAAIMVADAKAATLDVSVPLLSVADTMRGLEDLARLSRARTSARIIGVTGSVGKTGTKEALRMALGAQGRTYATEGNLNNHWGLPLSLARLPVDAEFGVFEMGMSSPGEISPLSQMARPHVAIITQVAEVHAAFFDSLQQIADAKAGIFDGLDVHDTAIINRDHPLFEHLRDHAVRRGVADIVSFGDHAAADVRLLGCTLFETSSTVDVEIGGERIAYRLGGAGRHLAINSLAVLAAVHAVGADVETAAGALAGLEAQAGRGQRREIAWRGGAFSVIDESYNASPAATEAAIDVLVTARPHGGGRRIAVLGDMLELGSRADALHGDLAAPLSAKGVDLVFTAGPHMAALRARLPQSMRGGHAASAKELAPLVASAVRDGDVVLVKGSLGSRMAEVVLALDALNGDDALSKAANGE